MIEIISFSGPELLLIAVWFLVALWNTSVGPAGGINFVTMASILPPDAVIPVQAFVEATSGVYRLWLLRLFIDWNFLKEFIIGGLVGFGGGVALRFVSEPSESALQVAMGAFILITAWFPLTKLVTRGRSFSSSVGLATSLIGLFVGGVAALIAAAAEQKNQDHRQAIANLTGGLLFHHSVKTALFGFFGFSFAGYAPLIAALLAVGFVGTWIGHRLLFNAPQHIIKPVFKALVTVLALNLLRQGLST